MTRKILLISSNFHPEPTGIAVYTSDLASLLRDKGFDVTVLTGMPHYPWWKTPIEFKSFSKGLSEFEGIRIVRARHYVPQKINVLTRAMYEMSFLTNFCRAEKILARFEFDLIVATIPTVAAGVFASRVCKRRKIPLGLIVQDLSGLGASQSGIKGGRVVSKLVSSLENLVLRNAKSIVGVSPEICFLVEKSGVDKSKVRTIYNYSAKNIVNQDMYESRKRFGFEPSDFIVLHSGNMGYKQDLENVVKAANHLPVDSGIKVMLFGHGNQEMKLRELISNEINIKIYPSVSDEDYSALLASANVLLLNERESQIDMSLPSKLTSYLLSGRPIIAAIPKNGASSNFLDGFAYLVDPGNPKKLAEAILNLQSNEKLRDSLSREGVRYANDVLRSDTGRASYLNFVDSLIFCD